MLKIERSVREMRATLKEMTDTIIKMVEAIKDSILRENFDSLEFIFQQDKKIDTLEKQLDQQGIALLALINPMASDLRFVFSVIKLNADLERIGDECKNVAKELKNVQPPIPNELKIMADKVFGMVTNAIAALLNQDSEKSKEVILNDDVVDELEYNIQQKYPESIKLLFAAKALERIADHTTNIAENVVYATEGIDIRHENSIMKRLKTTEN